MGVCLESSGDAWYCESQVYSIFPSAILRVLALKKETNIKNPQACGDQRLLMSQSAICEIEFWVA